MACVRVRRPRAGPLAAGLSACLVASAALSGPVEVYREGKYCPRDRPSGSPVLTEAQAVERAKALLPEGFCGPDWHVSGCDYLTEREYDTWRIYAHQYKEIGGRHEWAGRTHTYVILDPVGNCLANIPGTEVGAPR